MDTPSEIVDLIIDFASETDSRNPSNKHTLLVCALVCKTWLWPARYRLLSLDSRLRTVRVFPHDLLTLFDIFRSPLCTLDPGFVQVLEVPAQPGSEAEATVSFFALLSTLDRIPLPSLHTLCFRGVSLSFSKDEDNGSSSGSPSLMILSQIKNLAFENLNHNPLGFEKVIYATHLFPSLETLTARGTTGSQHRNEVVYSLRPPQSLRRLDVDGPTLFHMTDWLAAFGPKHTSISSLSICDSSTDHEKQIPALHLLRALDFLGPSLEELELALFPTLFNKYKFLFMKNGPLKRLLIRGELPHLVHLFIGFFTIINYVQRLETLEISIEPWDEKHLLPLRRFQHLDEFVKLCPSLQRIICTRELVFGERGWGEFKNNVRTNMSHCVEKDIVIFRKNSWEDDD